MTEPATPHIRPTERPRPIRPIASLLIVAIAAAAIVVLVVRGAPTGSNAVEVGSTVPNVTGTTLDGSTADLASLRGRPVILNFWGPSCIPCREEMPLLAQKATAHAADGLVILGVLMFDPVDQARAFAAQYGGSWKTVIDPDGAIRTAFHVNGRPQSYFIDRAGILRSIQLGPLTDADFERQLAAIAGGG